MKKVTEKVVSAFMQGKALKVSNTETDGTALFLHGNKIAEKRSDGLYVSNAGWMSNTTKERLNALPNVSIHQKNWQWYMNGELWGGKWTKVQD
jgi:hypothetical protein